MSSLEDRLRNWGRHWSSLPRFLAKCGSAEGNWTSPQVWDERLPKPLPADVRDAWLLERAWRRIPGKRHRDVLKFYYVKRWGRDRLSRMMRDDFDSLIYCAQAALLPQIEKLCAEEAIRHARIVYDRITFRAPCALATSRWEAEPSPQAATSL